jgi:hypothetical protein
VGRRVPGNEGRWGCLRVCDVGSRSILCFFVRIYKCVACARHTWCYIHNTMCVIHIITHMVLLYILIYIYNKDDYAHPRAWAAQRPRALPAPPLLLNGVEAEGLTPNWG